MYARNGKSINLSDILKTTEYEGSEYINLLEEITPSDLTSLSQYEIDTSKQQEAPVKFESTHKTPNFANRAQSKLPQLDVEGERKGRLLDMSLGDIPEEHEESATVSDNCRVRGSNSNSKSDGVEGKAGKVGREDSFIGEWRGFEGLVGCWRLMGYRVDGTRVISGHPS